MANSNFIVQNGLTVGGVTIDAASGNITTNGVFATTNSNGYLNTITGNVTITGNLTVQGTQTTVQNETTTGNFLPSANVTYNLGSTSFYWNNAYVNAVTSNGITVNSGKLLPGANAVVDIGSTSAWFNNIYGIATQAKYADLAENYLADKSYPAGTVLMFGGTKEVTMADADTTRVAGVVSTNPAHLMNGALTGPNVTPLALTGRVPCNIIGPVAKGDLMVSAGWGFAKTNNTPTVGSVIGKALEDFPSAAKGVIEVVVGRF